MKAAIGHLGLAGFQGQISVDELSVVDGRYEARLASGTAEIESALRLRHSVFNVELADATDANELEQDAFDLVCRHLIVVDRTTGETVGTYRLNSYETAGSADGFYSFSEFSIEDLPQDVLKHGVEVGRACIAAEHRNTKVLYLLWKGLARFLQLAKKRFLFGCCSIFSRDPLVGERAFHQLAKAGHFHDRLRVEPRRNALYLGPVSEIEREPVELPSLFNMYLRIGSKVCGPPIIDEDFGTIDFFVVFDRDEMTEKCRKTFFDGIG
jgi:putative hemolysin